MKKLRMDRVRAVATLHGHWSAIELKRFIESATPVCLLTTNDPSVIGRAEFPRGCEPEREVRAGLALALKRKGKR